MIFFCEIFDKKKSKKVGNIWWRGKNRSLQTYKSKINYGDKKRQKRTTTGKLDLKKSFDFSAM